MSCLPTHTPTHLSHQDKPPGGSSGPPSTDLGGACTVKTHTHTQAPSVVAPPPTHSGKSLLVLGPKPPSGPSPGWHPGLTQFLPRGSMRRKGGVYRQGLQPLLCSLPTRPGGASSLLRAVFISLSTQGSWHREDGHLPLPVSLILCNVNAHFPLARKSPEDSTL